jgi:hypothetical protein
VVPKLQQRLGAADDPSRNVFDLELVGKLIALGLKQDEAQDLYATTDEGQLRGTLEHVEQRLRSQTLPMLKSPAAYFKDALKKGYAGVRGAVEPAAPAALPSPSQARPAAALGDEDRTHRIRELWENDRMQKAKSLYLEMPEAMQAEMRSRFEADRLDQIAVPIARAWRRDGPASRIAATTFHRWLAQVTWPEEPSDRVLLDFALAQGVAGM